MDKVLRTPETQKKKKRERRIKLVVFSILFLILTIGPISASRMDRFLVKSIRIEGTSVTPEEEVQKIILENLDGNYLWLIPKSNALLYPKKKIENDLLRTIPRLTFAKASLLSPEELLVEVREREPHALYCKKAVIDGEIVPEDCYFLDEIGFIFAEAPAFSGDVYHIYSLDEPLSDPLGNKYLNEKKFKEVSMLIDELKLIGVHSRVFSIIGEEYHLYLANGADIMWKSSLGINQMYNNLSSFLLDKSVTADKNFLDKILYLDMRFGNKIFYKFRE